jgi:hypothetical protein
MNKLTHGFLFSIFVLGFTTACSTGDSKKLSDSELVNLQGKCRDHADKYLAEINNEETSADFFQRRYLHVSTYSVTDRLCYALVDEVSDYNKSDAVTDFRATILVDPISDLIYARKDVNGQKATTQYRLQIAPVAGRGFDGMTVVDELRWSQYVQSKIAQK